MHELDAEEVDKQNRTAIFGNEHLSTMAADRKTPEFKVDHRLTHEELLTIAGEKWQVLHTPGHTKGSMCLWHDKTKTLISGDTLFENSIGRTDFYSSNNDEMKDTLRFLKSLGIKHVLPGHGNTVSQATQAMVDQICDYFIPRL
jgi:glyoxylase-like metal-dependent hydrolase (beta-lactamase superfamily II)